MSREVMNLLDTAAQLASLKDVDYKNTLAISTLIELLIERGLFTRQEFAQKAQELEAESLADIIVKRRLEVKSPR